MVLIQTFSVVDDGKRLESRLDQQNIKPGVASYQPGLPGLTWPDSKGASNLGVMLDPGGPGALRTHFQLGTRRWRQILENIFDHPYNNASNPLRCYKPSTIPPNLHGFWGLNHLLVHRINLTLSLILVFFMIALHQFDPSPFKNSLNYNPHTSHCSSSLFVASVANFKRHWPGNAHFLPRAKYIVKFPCVTLTGWIHSHLRDSNIKQFWKIIDIFYRLISESEFTGLENSICMPKPFPVINRFKGIRYNPGQWSPRSCQPLLKRI